jgi:hypothetical protein
VQPLQAHYIHSVDKFSEKNECYGQIVYKAGKNETDYKEECIWTVRTPWANEIILDFEYSSGFDNNDLLDLVSNLALTQPNRIATLFSIQLVSSIQLFIRSLYFKSYCLYFMKMFKKDCS